MGTYEATLASKTSLDRIAPAGHRVERRKSPFAFTGEGIRNWHGNRIVTRIFDALQSSFPEGERAFIQSVRNFEHLIRDPKLAAEVKDFIYQEAQHGLAHDSINNALEEQGINMRPFYKAGKQFSRWQAEKWPKPFFLAMTAAAEHMTATLAEVGFQSNWRILGNASPELRALYMWHAVEEIEHKAVAWDVYEQVAEGDYLTRVSAMMVVMVLMPLSTAIVARKMLEIEEEPITVAEVMGLIKWLYGKDGLARNLPKPVARYFHPRFHPWKTPYPKNFALWKKTYEETGDMFAAERAVTAAG